MIKNIKRSEALEGEQVTTYLKYGGVGIGNLVDGVVYVMSGDGWAIEATMAPLPMISYKRDGGAGYMSRVTRIGVHNGRTK